MTSKYILLLFIFGFTFFASSQNVPPTISDPEQLETIRKERQLIFDRFFRIKRLSWIRSCSPQPQ